ncbi:MAG: mechanosensitive ion channel family protein [Clostridiales bacterium]|nr:mechanosensitive ion channel family protein [Clostridiales bacterium]
MPGFFERTFFGNTIFDYIWFLIAAAVSFLVLKVAERFVVKRLNLVSAKKKRQVDLSALRSVRRNIMPILYLTALYLCTKLLNLSPLLTEWSRHLILAITIAIGASLVSTLAVFVGSRLIKNAADDSQTKTVVKWSVAIIKVLVWTVALILFLDNIGVKISSLITGLGIGGIAIAFAAQAILVDVFCCFTIFFDKPFEVGDFIKTGEHSGTVEHIGLKTTRLRAPNGEQIVLANSDLTKSRINNFKTLEERRVLFTIGVTYETSSEKLRQIPDMIKEIVTSMEDVRFGRAHFCRYGAYSLEFEIVYFVLSKDYGKYMDVNQEIFLKMKDSFERHDIELAYPTQMLLLQKQN